MLNLQKKRLQNYQTIIVLFTIVFSQFAWSATLPPITITEQNVIDVMEGTGTFDVKFTITNNTQNNYYLDYAYASIENIGSDFTDTATFTGDSAFRAEILAGQTATLFRYTLTTQPPGSCDPNGCDMGVNPLTLAVEFQPNIDPSNNANNLYGATGNSTSELIGPQAFTNNPGGESQVEETLIKKCFKNLDAPECSQIPNGKLWANGFIATSTVNIDVFDLPEPTSIALLASGILGFSVSRKRLPI